MPGVATLRGKVKPAEALTRLTPVDFKHRQPGLRLRSLDVHRNLLPPSPDERHGIERDGSFSLRGVPPGSWEIGLEWWKEGMGGYGLNRQTSLLLAVRDRGVLCRIGIPGPADRPESPGSLPT